MVSDIAGDIRSVGALVRALGDEDCYVRQEAASALGAMGFATLCILRFYETGAV